MTVAHNNAKKPLIRSETLVYWGIAAFAFFMLAILINREPNLQSCSAIADQDQRLACFDTVARQNAHNPVK